MSSPVPPAPKVGEIPCHHSGSSASLGNGLTQEELDELSVTEHGRERPQKDTQWRPVASSGASFRQTKTGHERGRALPADPRLERKKCASGRLCLCRERPGVPRSLLCPGDDANELLPLGGSYRVEDEASPSTRRLGSSGASLGKADARAQEGDSARASHSFYAKAAAMSHAAFCCAGKKT
jgi:hypothetical protein